MMVLEVHQQPVTAAKFSGSGKLIASFSAAEAIVRVTKVKNTLLGLLTSSIINRRWLLTVVDATENPATDGSSGQAAGPASAFSSFLGSRVIVDHCR